MKKRLPIGISDFRQVIEESYYYVDKSLMIKEIIDSGSNTILFPRPRRFGKTLNLSMLRYFYEKTDEPTDQLFTDLAIAQAGEHYRQQQGKYPVIFLSLKDVKCRDWETCYKLLRQIISKEFERHSYLLRSNVMSAGEKDEYSQIVNHSADPIFYETSLKQLSHWLHQYHGNRVVILIDEYDTPIHEGYLHGYYDEVVRFVRNFLSGGLKDNVSLEKGVLTGILRVAKESIFSGLNHIKVYSLLTAQFHQYFGLLEHEVETLLQDYGITCEMSDVKQWYNGYRFWDTVIYNPWSILNYADSHQDGLRPYWVNTSSNDVIRQILRESSGEIKEDLECLLRGESITKELDDNIVFGDVKHLPDALWSFLLFSGYVTAESVELRDGIIYGQLRIPNQEVASLYRQIVLSWMKPHDRSHRLMLEALTAGEVADFQQIFTDLVRTSFSIFDASGQEAEKVYHAFVLGLLVRLQDDYQVKSNRESGYGRYDVMLIPHDKKRLGIVFEFKKARDKETLTEAARAALQQIDDKQYESELQQLGVVRVLKLGIAFAGKQVHIEYQ